MKIRKGMAGRTKNGSPCGERNDGDEVKAEDAQTQHKTQGALTPPMAGYEHDAERTDGGKREDDRTGRPTISGIFPRNWR